MSNRRSRRLQAIENELLQDNEEGIYTKKDGKNGDKQGRRRSYGLVEYGGNSSGRNGRRNQNGLSLTQHIVAKLQESEHSHIESHIIRNHRQNSKYFEINVRTHNYDLNVDKTLKKKHIACMRPISCETQVNDGSITIQCQAGLYELIKRATLLFYSEHHQSNRFTDIELWQDRKGNSTQAIIKVSPLHTKSDYTLNLYHTTSLIYINGKGTKSFLEKEWAQIEDIILEINQICKGTEPNTLNNNMRECLQQALQVLRKPKARKDKANHNAKHNMDDRALTSENDPQPNDVSRQDITRSDITMPSLEWTAPNESQLSKEALPPTLPTEAGTACSLDSGLDQPERETQQPPIIQDDSQGGPQPQDQTTEEPAGVSSVDHRIQAQQREDQPNTYCRNCHTMNMEMRAMEVEVQTAQRKLKLQDKAMTQREKDLNVKSTQYASARTHISALESQVRQLMETNKLLSDQLAALRRTEPNTEGLRTTPTAETPRPNLDSTRSDHGDRIAVLEARMQELRIAQLETKVENLIHDQLHTAANSRPTPVAQAMPTWNPMFTQPASPAPHLIGHHPPPYPWILPPTHPWLHRQRDLPQNPNAHRNQRHHYQGKAQGRPHQPTSQPNERATSKEPTHVKDTPNTSEQLAARDTQGNHTVEMTDPKTSGEYNAAKDAQISLPTSEPQDKPTGVTRHQRQFQQLYASNLSLDGMTLSGDRE